MNVGYDVATGGSMDKLIMLIHVLEFGFAVGMSLIEKNLRFVGPQTLQIMKAFGIAFKHVTV